VHAKDIILDIIRRLGVKANRGRIYTKGNIRPHVDGRADDRLQHVVEAVSRGYVNPDETTFEYMQDGRSFHGSRVRQGARGGSRWRPTPTPTHDDEMGSMQRRSSRR
jgi:homoaconitase/3-isopropylmalate dehydratase large subunit